MLQFIKSQKNKDLLVVNNFLFSLNGTGNEGVLYWRCVEYIRFGCPLRIHTKNNEIVRTVPEHGRHNHIATSTAVKTREVRLEISKRARETSEAPRHIIASALGGASTSVLGSLPSSILLKKQVPRERIRNDNQLENPASRREIQFPENLSKRANDELFSQYDSEEDNESQFFIFATRECLQLLKMSQD